MGTDLKSVPYDTPEGHRDITRPSPNPVAPPAPGSTGAPLDSTESASGWKHVTDAEVVAASLASDQDAWRELVARYSRLVYSIPRRYGLGREACDDVFQEVFAVFVRQLPGIRRQTGLPKWFITTTHRVCRQWFKRADASSGTGSDLLSARQPPPEMLVQWEQQHLVRQALRRLGGRCEQLLVALYTDQGGPGYEEVSTKLDMPQGSIGPARARCLRKLLEMMDSMDRDP